jgi:NADH dehydrogenase|tara:strand:+ start:360 stop:1286 length:927 start_codon:yes stop_codon:yes gene_type:complete
MENNKICTILGAGFVGRYVVKYLDRKGYRSIVISRNPFRKNYILTQARTGYVNIVKFNFTEIKKAIQKSDYVLNLIGILGPSEDFFKIHSELPDYISKVCATTECKKFIHVSAIGANKNSKSIYQQSKFSGEEKVLKNFNSSVIIRPSLVVGAEDEFTNLWGKLSIFPILPVVSSKFRFQPIFVNDLAKAIVNVIEIKGNEGKIIEIGGNKVISFGDMVKLILKIIGKKKLIIDMPLSLGKIVGAILQLLPGRPLLTKDQCLILGEKDNIVSGNYLTINDLKISPVDVEGKMSEWLYRYRDGGEFAKV